MLTALRATRLTGIAALLALTALLALPSATDAGQTSAASLLAAKAAARGAAYDGAERAWTAALPPAAPAGPLLTYDARTWIPKDPVNVVFAGVASAWDVNYDLEHWARRAWLDAKGGRQLVDTSGGWTSDSYQLAPAGSSAFPSARFHVRLFADGALTLADAHHDMPSHRCANGWDTASQQLVDSFRDPSGKPLWFVSGIYQVSGLAPGPGQVQCGRYDGVTTVVVLGDGTRQGVPASWSAIQALLASSAPAATSVT